MPISSPLAGEPDLPERSQVGLALRGVLFAVLVGGAVIGLALWIVSGMMASPSAAWPTLTPAAPGQGAPIRPDAPPGIVLVAGLVGAAGAAFLTAVAALAPIGSAYRRGGLAVVSAFATFVVAVLAVPLHHYFGRPGLLGLTLLCAAGAALLGHRTVARPRREA